MAARKELWTSLEAQCHHLQLRPRRTGTQRLTSLWNVRSRETGLSCPPSHGRPGLIPDSPPRPPPPRGSLRVTVPHAAGNGMSQAGQMSEEAESSGEPAVLTTEVPPAGTRVPYWGPRAGDPLTCCHIAPRLCSGLYQYPVPPCSVSLRELCCHTCRGRVGCQCRVEGARWQRGLCRPTLGGPTGVEN